MSQPYESYLAGLLTEEELLLEGRIWDKVKSGLMKAYDKTKSILSDYGDNVIAAVALILLVLYATKNKVTIDNIKDLEQADKQAREELKLTRGQKIKIRVDNAKEALEKLNIKQKDIDKIVDNAKDYEDAFHQVGMLAKGLRKKYPDKAAVKKALRVAGETYREKVVTSDFYEILGTRMLNTLEKIAYDKGMLTQKPMKVPPEELLPECRRFFNV